MARIKRKNADFQKVKLKVGRSLNPKGFNVTQTNFKSKKIKVSTQFKEVQPNTITLRNRTINDLFKRAVHPNTNSRHQAFIDILQLLNANKDAIEQHLASLLNVLGPAFHDTIGPVRKEAIRFWSFILENIPEIKIAAFSSVLIPHVSCAMTSLNHDVLMDSQQILDLCLDFIPAVITSSEKVLSNFISQISFTNKNVMVVERRGFRVSAQTSQTPSERVKLHNWRALVLFTLEKFLRISMACLSQEGTRPPILLPFYSRIKIPEIGVVRVVEFSNWESFIDELMPILLSIWVEAAPSPFRTIYYGEALSPIEDSKTMQVVVQVMCILLEWMKSSDAKRNSTEKITWFNDEFRTAICRRLMIYFPYSEGILFGKRKFADSEVSCMTLNLSICHIFAMLPEDQMVSFQKLQHRVTEYLSKLINSNAALGVDFLSEVIKILKVFVARSQLEMFETHLNGLLKRYCESDLKPKEKEIVLNFMKDLIIEFEHNKFMGNLSMMRHFVQSLFRDLLEMEQANKVERVTLDVIKKLSVLGFAPFLIELQENINILLNLIQSRDDDIQITVINFFSRLSHIPFDFFHALAKIVQSQPVLQAKRVVSLLGHLSHELLHPLTGIPAFLAKDYINFLLCLIVGIFKRDSDVYIETAQVEQELCKMYVPFHLSKYSVVRSGDLQRHVAISKAAIRTLTNLPNQEQLAHCIHTYVVKFTTECRCFPAHTGVSLLLLEAYLYQYGYGTVEIDCLLSINELTIALLMYELGLMYDEGLIEVAAFSVLPYLTVAGKILQNVTGVCALISQRIGGLNMYAQGVNTLRLMHLVINLKLIPLEGLGELINLMQKMLGHFGAELANERVWKDIHTQISLPPYSVQ